MAGSNSKTFRTTRRVSFSDTDMAGITHFTNFFRYLEDAEHEFLRHIGLNVSMQDVQGAFGFPKLVAECNYKSPARLDDVLEIELRISSDDGKTIQYDCAILRQNSIIATGFLQVACCRFPPNALPYPIPIPATVSNAIDQFTSH